MIGNTELLFIAILFLAIWAMLKSPKIIQRWMALLIIIVVVAIGLSAEILVCPSCYNDPVLRIVDTYCGYDGFVSGLDYLYYVLS